MEKKQTKSDLDIMRELAEDLVQMHNEEAIDLASWSNGLDLVRRFYVTADRSSVVIGNKRPEQPLLHHNRNKEYYLNAAKAKYAGDQYKSGCC